MQSMQEKTKTVEISVLMAVYNGEAFLREAIDSILQQSFTDFEFIIINDGSIDKTDEILQTYNDPRIVNIDIGFNVGLIESLNRGIQHAQGKYIARMDADDIALKDRFKFQIEAFQNNPKAIVVGTDYYSFSKEGKKRNTTHNDSDYLKSLLLFGPCFCHPSTMIRNVFKSKHIEYDRHYLHVEDFQLWTELSALGDFVNINKPLLIYRYHVNQISNLKRMEQMRKCAEIRQHYLGGLGFQFTEEQIKTHNFIGDNYFIKHKSELDDIQDWLLNLIHQNQTLTAFNDKAFNRIIGKMWWDSCGYSNLGLFAFRTFFRSEISLVYKFNLAQKLTLLIKCLLRMFKEG